MPIHTIKQKFQRKPASGDTYRKLIEPLQRGLGDTHSPMKAA